MFKPQLSKSILDITKSTERDYPPKRKMPWLADSFAEMEHFHEQNYTPGGGNIAPNPCGGNRSLNFDILPGTIDCDGGVQELVFILSDDFKCASIQQISGSGVTIGKHPIEKSRDVTDQLIRTPETVGIGGDVRNIVVGTLNPEDAGDDSIICFAAEDVCCGGLSIACVFTKNCGEDCSAADCELPSITGGDTINTNGSGQYTFNDAQGDVSWSVSGSGFSIDQDGLVTTSSACGTGTVTATDSCCGNFTKEIRSSVGHWELISDVITGGGLHRGGGGVCLGPYQSYTCDSVAGGTRLRYDGNRGCYCVPDSFNENPGVAPCAPADTQGACGGVGCSDPFGPCAKLEWITRVRTYTWDC